MKRSVQSSNYPQPTVISSSGKHDFVGRYSYTGTRDYTAMSCIPSGISFYYDYLEDYYKIYGYGHGLLVRVIEHLSNK